MRFAPCQGVKPLGSQGVPWAHARNSVRKACLLAGLKQLCGRFLGHFTAMNPVLSDLLPWKDQDSFWDLYRRLGERISALGASKCGHVSVFRGYEADMRGSRLDEMSQLKSHFALKTARFGRWKASGATHTYDRWIAADCQAWHCSGLIGGASADHFESEHPFVHCLRDLIHPNTVIFVRLLTHPHAMNMMNLDVRPAGHRHYPHRVAL